MFYNLKILIPVLLVFLLITNDAFSQSIQERQQKVNECFRSGDFKCAEKELKGIIRRQKKSPNLGRLYSDLGTIQRRLGKNKDAIKSYNKAIELSPERVVFLTNRATLHMQMNNFEKGSKDFERAISLDPNNYRIASDYALFKKNNGYIEESLSDYNQLIERFPDVSRLYNNRADTKLRLNDLEGATEDIDKALELDPDNPIATVTKGEILLEQGNNTDACKLFRKAIDLGLNPDQIQNLIDVCNE